MGVPPTSATSCAACSSLCFSYFLAISSLKLLLDTYTSPLSCLCQTRTELAGASKTYGGVKFSDGAWKNLDAFVPREVLQALNLALPSVWGKITVIWTFAVTWALVRWKRIMWGGRHYLISFESGFLKQTFSSQRSISKQNVAIQWWHIYHFQGKLRFISLASTFACRGWREKPTIWIISCCCLTLNESFAILCGLIPQNTGHLWTSV